MRVNRHLHIVVPLLAAAYVFLTVSPMTCGLDPVDGQRNSTHHHNHLSHSKFCSWACQVHPATGMVTPEWPFKPVDAVPLLAPIPASVPSPQLAHISVSRGPPAPAVHSL